MIHTSRFTAHFHLISLPVLAAVFALPLFAEDAPPTAPTKLAVRFDEGESAEYSWKVTSGSETTGIEDGKAFKLTSSVAFSSVLNMKGAGEKPIRADLPEKLPAVNIRFSGVDFTESRDLDGNRMDVAISKGRIKVKENGQIVADSENDTGGDLVDEYQSQLAGLEKASAVIAFDPAGRQSILEGEPALAAAISGGMKTGAARGSSLFPLLSGKDAVPGQSWTAVASIPEMGGFKLEHPVTVRSTMTFNGLETKGGKSLARVDIISSWDREDLSGVNGRGVKATVSKLEGMAAGSCLFDPATGKFVEGAIDQTIKYHLEGKLENGATAVDVRGETQFSFERKK